MKGGAFHHPRKFYILMFVTIAALVRFNMLVQLLIYLFYSVVTDLAKLRG